MGQQDGSLTVRIPETVARAFVNPAPLAPQQALGSWEVQEGSAQTAAVDRYALVTLGEMPAECLIEATVTFATGTTNFGLMLRASDDLESYCQVRLLVDGTTLVVYVGERAAFSGRIHDRREGE